jgi:hypothetical protein
MPSLCYTCLKWGHFTGSPECEGKPCHCGKKHHPLLHYDGQKTAKVFAIHSGHRRSGAWNVR